MSSFFGTKVNDAINKCLQTDDSIVVLRGIPIEVLDVDILKSIDYSGLIGNRLKYFSEAVSSNRKVYTYEEYLYLRDFLVSQFKKVFILNNNLYINYVPANNFFPDNVLEKMIAHYSDPEDVSEEANIDGIDEYASIFIGLKKHNDQVICCYVDDEKTQNIKVSYCTLFEADNYSNDLDESDEAYIDIVEDADYIDFIKKLSSEPRSICVNVSNYVGDRDRLLNGIRTVARNYKGITTVRIFKKREKRTGFNHRDEFTDILKRYWGHSEFRDIKVYDINKLESGKKVIETVSQEQVISDIVEQVEECTQSNNNYHDVFVTAPTGAGKSAMFQIPAIYLAEKYNLLTLVISPLIGLMNDQVKGLELRNYSAAKTINSDISPIVKQEIISKVQDGTYDILYLSPETLLGRSDVEQLIGDRTIGAIIVDEAHIVTTWGKGFRPDYWYLGDHIRKLRKRQLDKKGRSFVIATFTATAIYHGLEDMYTETINSLHMLNPITYLGYVKRNDISIDIERKMRASSRRSEYELDKNNELVALIKRALIMNKKMLVYFPTVGLIERSFKYMMSEKLYSNIARYYGPLDKDMKQAAYEDFLSGKKKIMFATKAFGMGIDIDDIEIVAHFAPTGNVCDYVQEIGRAARRPDLNGEAVYSYNSSDFKHINRMHGMSSVKKYQLLEVIRKIDEIYSNTIQSTSEVFATRKRNALLLDAQSFAYIFDNPVSDENDNINKVKTALLMIQKDFENKVGFSPINVRPIPLFSFGFFKLADETLYKLDKKYPQSVEVKNKKEGICKINLERIWNKDYRDYSFPQFKYLIYSHSADLVFNALYPMKSALCVNLAFEPDSDNQFNKVMKAVETFINLDIRSEKYCDVEDLSMHIADSCALPNYKARSIAEVVIASMSQYSSKFHQGTSKVFLTKPMNNGQIKYQFQNSSSMFFNWIRKYYGRILKENNDGIMYVVDDGSSDIKAMGTILGLLESFRVLSFEMIGGENSQLYIYINNIQSLKTIINMPFNYNNQLLENVGIRHLISVKMLTYLYENDFSSDEVWDILEDYFLGIIPNKVKEACKKENPDISF